METVKRVRFCFWYELPYLDSCDWCKKQSLYFFPSIRFRIAKASRKINEIKLNFGVSCRACIGVAKEDLLMSLELKTKGMLQTLISWIRDICTEISKDSRCLTSIDVFLSAFQKEISKGRDVFLDNMGKQGDLPCMFCYKPSKARCAKCHTIRYCSDECRICLWPRHKKECDKISKMPLCFVL